MRTARTIPLLAVALAAGCGSLTGINFDPEEYDPIPVIQDLDWSAVQPDREWDYWEFRGVGPDLEHTVLGAGGRLERDDLDAATREALDATAPTAGFGEGCLPGTCYRYVVAVDGGDLTTINTPDALAGFIGDIDSRDEAILRVAARAHTWWDDGAHTGIRPEVDGWDLVVLETVAFCEPVQTDRVRFYVALDGRIEPGAREVWQRNENACI